MGYYQGGGNSNRGNGSYSGGRPTNTGFSQQESAAEKKFRDLSYKSEWIVTGADEALVSYAEEAGKFMAKNKLTNSKIRSIYGEIKRIQMGEFDKERSAFYLLKPKVAYALGRDEGNEGLKLFKLVFDKCSQDVKDQKSYQNFCNFIEAILAYHKANGGKD
jgi:CRISPR-associated protein Csm2